MYLHKDDIEASNYDLIDLNTGTVIPLVQEANDETGEFTVYMRTFEGEWVYDKNNPKEIALLKIKGNIKLVRKDNLKP